MPAPHTHMYFLIGSILVAQTWALSHHHGVHNLIAEPDYKQVKLHWQTDDVSSKGYQIKFCEVHSLGPERCRMQSVINSNQSADVRGLRMATTYSFEVKPSRREDRADDNDSSAIIVVPTKGFSAKATQCLPGASDIEVATGPYFGGRIAVESKEGEKCALDGDPLSPNDTYTLRINHTECGSHVNQTTVSTFVIVQENLPILTHSTRRFLVLCTYQPETLTVRAGINLPAVMGSGEAVSYDDRRSRSARKLKAEPLVDRIENRIADEQAERSYWLPIMLMIMVLGIGVAAAVVIILKMVRSMHLNHEDCQSVTSEVSTCSSYSDEPVLSQHI